MDTMNNVVLPKSIQAMAEVEEKYPLTIYCLKKIVATVLFFYFIIFFIFHKYSFWLQRHLLFMHIVRWPLFSDLTKPEKVGLQGVKNFYLYTKDNVKIGVWQVLPSSYVKAEGNSAESFDEALGDGKPIIVYVHGNTGNRATHHRVELYKLLQKQDYHVIAFDYRCYGDSGNVLPDEVGVVEDASTILRWVLERKKLSPVFVWGHSLGTGVSSRAVVELEASGATVDGVILESPFNNLKDAIQNHVLALIFKDMIGFKQLIVDPIQKNGITFKSDEYLSRTQIPLLIMHSKNDWIVPCYLGKKLVEYLKKNRPNADQNVKYVEFGIKVDSYGHKYICNAPRLRDIIKSFIAGKINDIPTEVE